ncbi:MAG: hypothetical protein ACTSRI_21620 [Promethearchaeota archaeon]
MLNKEDIIKVCSDNLPSFRNIIKGIEFKKEGIFNSEMLLIISIVKYFGIEMIIESGRANGQSTKIISETFKNQKHKIYSIEYNKYCHHIKTSFERLRSYKNLRLMFGDSFKEIPKLITKECCILIDGPKDIDAIKLAIESLNNPLVKAVFIHDMDKDSPFRECAEKVFQNSFFTDTMDYVEKFKSLDKNCWIELRKHRKYRSIAPYRKGNKKKRSYTGTLLLIMNSFKLYDKKFLNTLCNEKELYMKKVKKELKEILSLKYFFEILTIYIKSFFQFPFFYIYYEKNIGNTKNLDMYDFLKQWIKVIKKDVIENIQKKIKFFSVWISHRLG